MRLGFGLYRHMLNDENFRFARQAGATDLVVHMTEYYLPEGIEQAQDLSNVEKIVASSGEIWSAEQLIEIRKQVEGHGLRLYALENFDPLHWSDILFDGPRRNEQIELVKQIIRNVGAAGIPNFGYYFSLAGLAGRVSGPWGRGGAEVVAMRGLKPELDQPLPRSMAWNALVDPQATGFHEPTDHEEVWRRLTAFLEELLPVAEEAGVSLAAHPDDPPIKVSRGQARLLTDPDDYEQLLSISDSPSNKLEFCVGTISEMPTGDVYAAIEKFARRGRISYVHLRNVKGHAPNFVETFIDDGDVDMRRVIRILREADYQGVIIPDHAAEMACAAPWHAGMAYAMGYIRALLSEDANTAAA